MTTDNVDGGRDDGLRQRIEALADAWEGKNESRGQRFRRIAAKDFESYRYAAALRRALDGDQ